MYIINAIKKYKILIEVIIIISSLIAVIHYAYHWWDTERTIIEQTKISINNEADIAVNEFNNKLLDLMSNEQAFADDLTNGKIAYQDIEKNLRKTLEDNRKGNAKTKMYNLSVSFPKGGYDIKKPDELKNFMYTYNETTSDFIMSKREYDYTVDDANDPTKAVWFTKTFKEGKAFWQQPKYSQTSNSFVVVYAVPFFTSPTKEKVAGVITSSFSINEFNAMLSNMDYLKTGFGIILSDEKSLIYYPNNLLPLINAGNYKKYTNSSFDFIERIKNNEGINSFTLPHNNEKVWVTSKRIPATNWDYHIVFMKDELGIQQRILPTELSLIISVIIFLIACAFVIFLSQGDDEKDLWWFSLIFSIIFVIGTGVLWRLSDLQDTQLPDTMKKIKSGKEIEMYKQEVNQLMQATHNNKKLFFIPTGVFINSARFEGSNDVKVSGFIWQKYQLDAHLKADEIPDKFCDLATDLIPEQKNILLVESFEDYDKTNLTCDKASYKEVHGRTVTLGWYFNGQLRQPFDYSNFPLDKNLIWVRMRPTSIYEDYIVFIPDFDGYHYIYEDALMGIDVNNFVLPSWKVIGGFFSIQKSELNTNFGLSFNKGFLMQELLFNVEIKRNFLDTFFSTVVPIFLVYLILFVILFSSLEDILAILGISAGLLFSVALWHSGLRSSLASTGVSYFETFYFVCYFVISLVCVNSVLLACNYELAWLHHRDNLISKLVFFPLVCSLTFFITLDLLF